MTWWFDDVIGNVSNGKKSFTQQTSMRALRQFYQFYLVLSLAFCTNSENFVFSLISVCACVYLAGCFSSEVLLTMWFGHFFATFNDADWTKTKFRMKYLNFCKIIGKLTAEDEQKNNRSQRLGISKCKMFAFALISGVYDGYFVAA